MTGAPWRGALSWDPGQDYPVAGLLEPLREYLLPFRSPPFGVPPSNPVSTLAPGYYLRIARGPRRSLVKRRVTALASTYLIERAHASAHNSDLKRLAGWVIIGAISFNAVLCFLNTRGIAISNFHVMLSEALLILGAGIACRKEMNFVQFSVIAAIILYTAILCTIRKINAPAAVFDPKIIRDLLIPAIFFLLGKAAGDVKAADKVVFISTSIVIGFAIFEYFFLGTFLKIFGVAEYYIARGTLAKLSHHSLNVAKGTMVSGFQFLKASAAAHCCHSSAIIASRRSLLEPITLGNFGAWVTLWAVLRSRMEGRLYLWCALGGLTLLVLSDARFDAGFLVLGVVMLMIPPRIATLPLFLLPFLVLIALYIFAAAAGPFAAVPSSKASASTTVCSIAAASSSSSTRPTGLGSRRRAQTSWMQAMPTS